MAFRCYKGIKTSEGEIRGAQVRILEKNKKQPLTIPRPVQKLFPLEFNKEQLRFTSSPGNKDEQKNHSKDGRDTA